MGLITIPTFFSEYRRYLGFSVSEMNRMVYYTFNSLRFGNRMAGHMDKKTVQGSVPFLRAMVHKVTMF